MKKNMFKRFAIGFAALASATLLAQSGQAATLTYSNGDLLLGFYDSSVSNDYVIDIGAASTFIGATGTISLGNIGADLTSVFGSGWATNSALTWAVAGTTGATGAGSIASKTNFLSQQETTAGTFNTSFKNLSGLAATVDSEINGVSGLSGSGGYNGQTGNATNAAGLIQATSATNSWGTDLGGTSGTNAGFKSTKNIEGTFANGASGTVLDIDEVTSAGNTTSGTVLGSLTINGSGDLTFTSVTAAPEPSTYALIGLSGLLVLAFRSRMKRATV
jgi:hypothetical protein